MGNRPEKPLPVLHELRVRGPETRTLSGVQALLSNKSRPGIVVRPVIIGVLFSIFKSIPTDTEHRMQVDS